MKTEFDAYARRYEETVRRSIGFSGQEVDFFTRAKARALVEVAEEELGELSRLDALDVGCGIGLTDRLLADAFGSLSGLDVSEAAIEVAAEENPRVRYAAYDGETFPFADAAFNVVFAICVLHHVPPPLRPSLVAEMARVARPGGIVVVFEHNPYNPLTRLVVRRCEFDEDAVLLPRRETKRLLAGSKLTLAYERYILFFPRDGAVVRRCERAFRRVPLGAQYLVAGRR